MVADALRAQQHLAPVEVQPLMEGPGAWRTQRQRCRGGERHLAGVDQVQHAVLQHLGVGGEALEGGSRQFGQDRIGGVAHAGLQGQQVRGQPARLHFV